MSDTDPTTPAADSAPSAPSGSIRDHLAAALDAARPDLGPRLGVDPAAHLDLVALVRDARRESDVLLRAAVVSARHAGCTWEQLGGVLGMTRQAVHQRFGRPEDVDDAPTGAGLDDDARGDLVVRERRTLAPVTAFTEMAALARLGRFGWHAVGYGALRFELEHDEHQWEHLRLLSWQRGPSGEGWRPVGTGWFPWAYWARPLPERALTPPEGFDPFVV